LLFDDKLFELNPINNKQVDKDENWKSYKEFVNINLFVIPLYTNENRDVNFDNNSVIKLFIL
jgi:hypothetical protein